jgi:hypothetical protein
MGSEAVRVNVDLPHDPAFGKFHAVKKRCHLSVPLSGLKLL